jgi:thermosome
MATAIPAVTQSGQPVLILKEGTSQTRGREAQRNNILAAKLLSEVVRTSLGPRGMDKMLVDSLGDVTITNDGATILKEIDVQHPAAKMLVEVAKATDNEVGDGTTSSVVLAGFLLDKAEELIEREVHPTLIVEGYRKAGEKALEVLKARALKVSPDDKESLKKVALTAMLTKLVAEEAEYLADLAVEAILQVREPYDGGWKVDRDAVKVEKKPGGSIKDTKLIRGIVLDKEVVHPGMPKQVKNAKIALINAPLEVEKTELDAKININSPDQIRLFLDEENKILKGMVDKIVSVGANVVICQKGIDDVAQHYLAKAGILAVRRVKQSDMEKLAKATGGRIVTNLEDLSPQDLGFAELVEERRLEEDKWVFIEGCKNPKSVTILIRGGTQRVVDEAERSVNDALMVTKDVVEYSYIVPGAGAPEAVAAAEVRKWASSLPGREQLAAQRFAEALEQLPLTIAENAGLDPIDIQTGLRAKLSSGVSWPGVDVEKGEVADAAKLNVWEPLAVKEQVIKSAVEAASMILRIDDIIAASKAKEPTKPKTGEEGEGAGGSTPSFED